MRQKPSSMPCADERLLHEVVVADRGAAERHQHVGHRAPRAAHGRSERADLVGRDAKIDRRRRRTPRRRPATAKLFEATICDGPGVPPGATSSSPVARIATRARRRTGSMSVVRRRGQRDVARREAPAGGDQGLALRGSRGPPRAGCRPAARGGREPDPVALALHVLLNDDRVGALGHRRAGEDAHRLPGPTTPSNARPAADSPITSGQGRLGRRIGGAQRIAVHGGIGERRLGAQRRDVAREHAAVGGFERERVPRRAAARRRRARAPAPPRRVIMPLIRASPRARHSPDLPPRFSSSRTPSMLMPRSIALAMS